MSELPARAVAADDVVHRVMDGKTVLLHIGAGQYYSLDPVGTFVWERLQESPDVNAAVEAIVARYDVESERAREDIAKLLDDLEQHAIVTLER